MKGAFEQPASPPYAQPEQEASGPHGKDGERTKGAAQAKIRSEEADLAAQRAPGAFPSNKRETRAELTPPMDPVDLATELLAPSRNASSLCSGRRIYHRQEDETSACFK